MPFLFRKRVIFFNYKFEVILFLMFHLGHQTEAADILENSKVNQPFFFSDHVWEQFPVFADVFESTIFYCLLAFSSSP